jgi:hypothetical protein
MRKLILLGTTTALLLATAGPASGTSTVSPNSAVDYGRVKVGTTVSRAFTITMSADETRRQVTLAIGHRKGWTVRRGSCPSLIDDGRETSSGSFVMPPGAQTCQIALDFAAQTGGPRTANMTVAIHDPGCTSPPPAVCSDPSVQILAQIPLSATVTGATTCKKKKGKKRASSAKKKKCKKKKKK